MNNPAALVSILIATRDRAPELRFSLQEMRRQRYPSLELLIIDDGSSEPMARTVLGVWPNATVIRHEASAGQCARRNEGFVLANGDFILQLDDDCSLINPDDLARAVRALQDNPEAGAATFFIVNSLTLPAKIDTSKLSAGCVASFMGAAVLFRKAALEQTTGYRSFFGNEWEEEELGLQLLGRNWKIIFIPQIIAHHRLSPLNRNGSRTWMRGLRNRTWAMMIHMPFPRIVLEVGWKLLLGAWDAIRLRRIRLFFRALSESITGLRGVLPLRSPLSPLALRRYDLLRLHAVITSEGFDNPTPANWKSLRGFWNRWQNRARNASIWDKQHTDMGTSSTVLFAHETDPNPCQARNKKTV